MNRTKCTKLFCAGWQSALALCTVLLLALTALAQTTINDANINDFLNEDGLLVVNTGNFRIENLADSLVGIVIDSNATLELEPHAMLHVSGGYVAVRGMLVVPSILGTGIYNSTDPWNGIEELQPDKNTTFYIGGGTVKITQGNASPFFADTINVILEAGGGTIDVENDVIFATGSVIGQQPGRDVTKIGGGTWHVGSVNLLGNFTVREGDVVFLDHAAIGRLVVDAGTSISGLQSDGETKSNINVQNGNIAGNLESIGRLLIGDGNAKNTFTIDAGQHSIEEVIIRLHSTLDMKADTSIQLSSQTDYALVVYGTLKAEASNGSQIYKGDIGNPDTAQITLIGSIDNVGNVTGGIIEIEQGDSPGGIRFDARMNNIEIIGIGKVSVAENIRFESGQVSFGTNGNASVEGAHLIVSGGGTYQTDQINIGRGLLIVEEDGTALHTLGSITAERLITEAGTNVIASGDAAFNDATILGNYSGNNHHLTLQKGGRIAGQIVDVNKLTLADGGTLVLDISETGMPIVSVNTWEITRPQSTQIQVVGGIDNTVYNNIIEVKDGNMTSLLPLLQSAKTALYRPTWTQEGQFLHLNLTNLSVASYVRDDWKQSGENYNNAAMFLDDAAAGDAAIRETLEKLNHGQLRNLTHNTMAGELAGNAMRIALHQPAHSVFRYLDDIASTHSPFAGFGKTRGQVKEGFNLWLNPYGLYESAKGDSGTVDGYDLYRYGFYVGGDIDVYNKAVAGILFGYAAPYIESDLGKITANDYTAGMYVRMVTGWEIMLNVMLGFGSQDYHYKTYASKFSGNSYFASAEWTRPFENTFRGALTGLEADYRLIPLVAFDFQSAKMDPFSVPSTIGRMAIDTDKLDTMAVRVGMLSEFWRLRTRVQYIRHIGGDDYVWSATSFSSGENLASSTSIRSTKWGRNWLNVGMGYNLYATQSWRIFADYNFDMGRRTTSHFCSINSVLQW
ncbi:MAG: autotransporter domain-containing protein [Planctomycetaceae bacterium]|nr:autotransporter domain-containing protein [Planctomycetaceae bacterium]